MESHIWVSYPCLYLLGRTIGKLTRRSAKTRPTRCFSAFRGPLPRKVSSSLDVMKLCLPGSRQSVDSSVKLCQVRNQSTNHFGHFLLWFESPWHLSEQRRAQFSIAGIPAWLQLPFAAFSLNAHVYRVSAQPTVSAFLPPGPP